MAVAVGQRFRGVLWLARRRSPACCVGPFILVDRARRALPALRRDPGGARHARPACGGRGRADHLHGGEDGAAALRTRRAGAARLSPSLPSSAIGVVELPLVLVARRRSRRSASPSLVEAAVNDDEATLWIAGASISLCCRFSRSAASTPILPEVHRQVVDVHGWMTSERFTDLFAIAQAAPGPNFLVVTLIGFEVAGMPGALVATLAIIGPTSILAYCVARVWSASARRAGGSRSRPASCRSRSASSRPAPISSPAPPTRATPRSPSRSSPPWRSTARKLHPLLLPRPAAPALAAGLGLLLSGLVGRGMRGG